MGFVDYNDVADDNVLSVGTEVADDATETWDKSSVAVGINVGFPEEDGSLSFVGVNLGPDSVAALIAQLQSWQRREVFGT